jgi:HD-GYP domain-containing protein (c-di-GMP phosphodiesterase class II)
VGVALGVGEETIGWLLVEASAPDALPGLVSLLATIHPAVAVGVDGAKRITRMRVRSERLAAANVLARSLGAITDFERLVDALGRGIEPVLGCTRVAIYDADARLLVEHGQLTAPRAELGLARKAVRSGSQHRVSASGIDAFAVPLQHLHTVRAVLYVERPDEVGASFDDHDRALLENVAEQANATLAVIAAYDELERNYLSTIQALAGALEASDQYTHDHAQDVAKWAIEVGRRLGMDGRELRDLELGAVFHDIGKIAIPNEILNKPGKLTDAEFEVMKTHTIIGERIIAPISFLERVRPIVRHEHERWDGRGYPDGVAGEDIPLGSRIIFVCDAYHAITSTRPYRKAQPHDVAREVLVENAGTQFDPAVVQVFLDVIEDHLAGRSAGELAMPEAHEPAKVEIEPARAVQVFRQRDVA